MKKHFWTEEEILFLNKNYLKYPNKELSEQLKLPKDIVRDKMYKLKLKRPPELIINWKSEMYKGSKNPFYGKTHSTGVKETIRKKAKGRKLSEATKRKLSIRFSGKGNPRYGTHGWNKGIHHTKEHRRRIGIAQTGEKNHMWKGGIFEEYTYRFKKIRENIRKRDSYTCFICGYKQNPEETNRQKILTVHHINENKKDDRDINLISLCRKCHGKTFKKKDYWVAFFCNHLHINQEELLKPILRKMLLS
jgi:hypothetical protein